LKLVYELKKIKILSKKIATGSLNLKATCNLTNMQSWMASVFLLLKICITIVGKTSPLSTKILQISGRKFRRRRRKCHLIIDENITIVDKNVTTVKNFFC
jgi:hypothetical protein